MPQIVVIAHNIRSVFNVGSIFRTCEGFGVTKLILSGYTPYPEYEGDSRLPHERSKLTAQIHKTALGAETFVPFEHHVQPDIEGLRTAGYRIVGLEQYQNSIMINEYDVPEKIALILGEEVEGIGASLLTVCDDIVEIPMHGQKESFNVGVATGIALYALTKSRAPFQKERGSTV